MNTLLSISLINAIKKWNPAVNILNKLTDDKNSFPLEIEGIQGCFAGIFTSLYVNSCKNKFIQQIQYLSAKKNIKDETAVSCDTVIVVPTEKEESSVIQDLQTFLSDAEIITLPWWSTVPYRASPKGSIVFGKRAGALAKIAAENSIKSISKKSRIFVMTQRSFLTPVPPPEYLKKNIFTFEKGQSFDTIQIAQKLVSLGYVRVPKVSVPGEFTLRGEVLDI